MDALFRCPACEKVTVTRPADSDRPMPVCMSCDEATGGICEMVWIRDVERNP